MAALLALAVIDLDTGLLPDTICLPLMWAGLTAAAMRLTPITLDQAFWGAAAGYLSLWILYQVHRLTTGREGMGHGDFKLLAALGAWLGGSALIPIAVVAALSACTATLLISVARRAWSPQQPFGPHLAASAVLVMMVGPRALAHSVGVI